MLNLAATNEITELCKGVRCVDLGESFQTHIYLQNLASIQPRTSPVKFARSSNAAESNPLNSGRKNEGSRELHQLSRERIDGDIAGITKLS